MVVIAREKVGTNDLTIWGKLLKGREYLSTVVISASSPLSGRHPPHEPAIRARWPIWALRRLDAAAA